MKYFSHKLGRYIKIFDVYNNVLCCSLSELDDGSYNPLWATRGFTQTFHLWKEGKRQQSTPLNAYLTYVTLPWWTIAKGRYKTPASTLY